VTCPLSLSPISSLSPYRSNHEAPGRFPGGDGSRPESRVGLQRRERYSSGSDNLARSEGSSKSRQWGLTSPPHGRLRASVVLPTCRAPSSATAGNRLRSRTSLGSAVRRIIPCNYSTPWQKCRVFRAYAHGAIAIASDAWRPSMPFHKNHTMLRNNQQRTRRPSATDRHGSSKVESDAAVPGRIITWPSANRPSAAQSRVRWVDK
jgi:hypothetical protein